MKKVLYAATVLLALPATGAMAQQYTRPIYNDDGYQSYATRQPVAQQAIPSQSNGYAYGSNSRSNSAAPARPGPAYAAGSRPYSWNGCYGGLYVGGAFGGHVDAHELESQGGTFASGTPYNLTTDPYGYDLGNQVIGGGTLGCSYEIPVTVAGATGLVLGLEGEGGSFSLVGHGHDTNDAGNINNDTPDKTSIGNYDGIVAARAGVAFDRLMVYGKLGAFLANSKSSIVDSCSTFPCGDGTVDATSNRFLTDLAAGGGVEYAVTDAWSVKGEYMYLDTTDSYEVCGAGGAFASGSNFCSQHSLNGTHTIKLGLNYHFFTFGG